MTDTNEQPTTEKQPEKTVAPVAAVNHRDLIPVNEGGQAMPTTVQQQIAFAKDLCTSDMVPARFKNKAKDTWIAIQTAGELGLKPITALRQMAVIKGTPSLFGDLPLALAWQSGKLECLDEYFLDENGSKLTEENKNLFAEPFAAVCKVKRKDDPEVYTSVFTVNDARKAGLLPARSGSCWANYQSDMMKYRARARALKAKCADAINGIAIAEYDFHTIPGLENNDVEILDSADTYNNKYLGEGNAKD